MRILNWGLPLQQEIYKEKVTQKISEEENSISEYFINLVERMILSNQVPLCEDIVATKEKPLSVLLRKNVMPRLAEKLKDF